MVFNCFLYFGVRIGYFAYNQTKLDAFFVEVFGDSGTLNNLTADVFIKKYFMANLLSFFFSFLFSFVLFLNDYKAQLKDVYYRNHEVAGCYVWILIHQGWTLK